MFAALKKKRRDKRKAGELRALIRQKALWQTLQYQQLALNSRESGLVAEPRQRPLVVSLTTFSHRIRDVHLTIESLFQQSCKADKILLWISQEDFTPADIPAILRTQCERGLEIRFCERDLGPYTKFFYSLQAYPDALLLTVDDDLLYPVDMIDQLYSAHLKTPQMIHCHRAHIMRCDQARQLLPYKQWDWSNSDHAASLNVFPTGVGGVLYFPGCFDPEVLNREAFLQLCPNSDDVWLKAMSLKRGTLCKKVEDPRDWSMRFVTIEGSQQFSLKRRNKSRAHGNDAKLKAVFDAYQLWDTLAEGEL